MSTLPRILWSQTAHNQDHNQNCITMVLQGDKILPSDITLTPTSFSLNGEKCACSFELYDEINHMQPSYEFDGGWLVVKVPKKSLSGLYWPTLTREQLPFIVTDFNRVSNRLCP
ncbi:hypothetical protein BO86DRAFT_390035 [Aspergillus japonicus CBS 114.51]|uniref:CS domain-containing protein n=1 Tax=Aspergillus japonicus CBS 114.51 TaxID=1448312 RepID=A0A8T8WYA1_ASPJA|nr:hypothetical protein BO86DRAFT_390035 [Aspergillus japonicus CBS 114.51]RAH80867.1 hypothetical protein BO86DRAFT_390035 [Aspergillus japonicus CBS 114.51]